METKKVHASCLKIIFGPKSKMPTDREIFGFFRTRNWTCEILTAMFREPKEYAVYVMFRTEEIMKTELLKCPPSATFVYEGHQETKVTFAAARGNFKYVRIFGLPIEVEDKHVASVMSKYGKIQHMVRERYGTDTGYPILNGVRGVHIDMETEIPSQIYVQHFPAKVFYEGMTSKCFVCGGTDHVKANCPKRVSVNARLNQTSGQGTYAGVVVDGAKKDVFPTLLDIAKEPSGVSELKAAQQSVEVAGDATSESAGPSKPLTEAALLELPLEDAKEDEAEEISPTAEMEQDSDSMDFEEVKSKKRSRKQHKDSSTTSQQRSNSTTSDSDTTSATKVKINAPGNDLMGMQVTRSRSKQNKK